MDLLHWILYLAMFFIRIVLKTYCFESFSLLCLFLFFVLKLRNFVNFLLQLEVPLPSSFTLCHGIGYISTQSNKWIFINPSRYQGFEKYI